MADHIILTRHAEYDHSCGDDGPMNALGYYQAREIGRIIHSTIPDITSCIVTSTARRAVSTAATIGSSLGTPIGRTFEERYLWDANDAPEDTIATDHKWERYVDIVDGYRDRAQVLIVVGHYGSTEMHAKQLASNELGLNFDCDDSKYCATFHLDMVARTAKVLFPTEELPELPGIPEIE